MTNFDITIRGDTAPYAALAGYETRTAEGYFDQESTLPYWAEAARILDNPSQPPGSQMLDEAGSLLFEQLMQRDIRDLWVRARTDLETQKIQALRLRLALHPPLVASLPWECLFDPDRNETFAASSRIHLVRTENAYRHVAPSHTLHARLPLKLLLVIPEAADGLLDSAREVARIYDALAFVRSRVEIAVLDGRFDVVTLGQRVQQEAPDILHIIGHGQPDGIWLWRQNEPALATASSLRTVLQPHPSVKLAFLNVCLAGSSSPTTPFATVAPQLLQAGIPSIIAMQFAFHDDMAANFAQYVYRALLCGQQPGAIDAAVTYARSNLYALNPDSFAYGTPVLWLNAPDGVIFTLDVPQTERGADSQSASSASNGIGAIPYTAAEEITLLRIQADEIERWLHQLGEVNPHERPADMRGLFNVWNRGINNLRDLFRQLRHLEAEPNADAVLIRYRQKIAQIRQQRREIANIEQIVRTQGQNTPE